MFYKTTSGRKEVFLSTTSQYGLGAKDKQKSQAVLFPKTNKQNLNVLSNIRYKIMCNFCQITPNIMQRIRTKKFMKPTCFSVSILKGTN